MPRNVRNFWIEVEIDGRTTKLAGGPRSKDGGFTLRIKQRSKGDIITPVHIEGKADIRQLRTIVQITQPDDSIQRKAILTER